MAGRRTSRADTPGIKDVAKRANVSVGTVSRVLAKNETVNPDLREVVEAAIRELNFRPNGLARGLRRSRSDMIGLVIPDITNPFFAELAKHVEAVASAAGFSVLLSVSNDDPQRERTQVESLLNSFPTGIIVVPTHRPSAEPWISDIATVVLDRPFAEYPLISVDHYGGAGLAAKHLLELGHRRIGYIAGPADTPVSRQRLDGFRDTLAAGGVTPLVVEGQFDYASGETLGRALLDRATAKRPTAIATASDQQAIGLLRVVNDLGLGVPGDLSIVGFDDISLASLVTPRLTTVRQPLDLIAACAVATVTGAGVMPTEPRRQPAMLVVRESTGRAA